MMYVTSFEVVGKTRMGQEICHLVRSKAEASLADSNQAGSSNALWESGNGRLAPALLASIWCRDQNRPLKSLQLDKECGVFCSASFHHQLQQ